MNIDRKILNAAVVGLGHIGKRHATMIKAHLDFKLVGTCDIKDRAHLDFEDNSSHYSDLNDLIQNEKLDVLSVCTPNYLHAGQSVLALSKKIHVICEKPLALEYREALEMASAAVESERELFCVLQNRYSPTIQWLKHILDKKALGSIHWIQIQCFWNRDDRYYFEMDEKEESHPHPWHGSMKKDRGPLFTQFSHFIDILIHLFGEMSVLNADFHDFNHTHSTEFEDSGRVSLKSHNGMPVELTYTTALWDRNEESSINIIGSKGTVKVAGQYMNSLEYCHVDGMTTPDLPAAGVPNEYGGYVGSANNHFHIFENVANVLIRNQQSDLPLDDAIHGVQLIEEIYKLRKGW